MMNEHIRGTRTKETTEGFAPPPQREVCACVLQHHFSGLEFALINLIFQLDRVKVKRKANSLHDGSQSNHHISEKLSNKTLFILKYLSTSYDGARNQ